jgi:hypothetical protein
MVTVDELESEVVVEGSEPQRQEPAASGDEQRRDELREVVRALVREELRIWLRTEARRR